MKKIIIIGFVVALVATGLLLWLHFKHPSDAKFSRQIIGSWKVWNTSHTNTLTVLTDGSFSYSRAATNSDYDFVYVGAWQIRGGRMMMTVTNINGHPSSPISNFFNSKIIYLGDHELIVTRDSQHTNSFER